MLRGILMTVAILSAPVFGDEWPVLFSDVVQRVEGKPGSMALHADAAGELSASIDARVIEISSRQTIFVQFAVAIPECSKGAGKLMVSNLDGSDIRTADFLFGGGTYASDVAENLCRLAQKAVKQASAPKISS